jgi:putative glutamine amidotransferase
MKKAMRAFVLLLLLAFSLEAAETEGFPQGVPVIVLTHPTASQVNNIWQMYEKDVIPLKSLVLLGIYHEDELANEEEAKAYQDAFAFAKENRLSWVRFRKLIGRVEIKDLFRENLWTEQFREIFTAASGIIFTGGMDIPPAVYGQGTSLLTEPTTPARHLYEISFLFHLLGGERNPAFTPLLAGRKDFPILAICLGFQSLNVALGGTLVQDIPSEVYGCKTVEEVLAADSDRIHSSRYLEKLCPNDPDLAFSFHRVRLGPDSAFVRRMGFSVSDHPFVITSHHQAIAKLGTGLRVTTVSMDGKIIEAVEHARYANTLGIQFHPEASALYSKGLLLRRKCADPLDFNPLAFLKANPPTYAFHLAIWKWFSEMVSVQN